MSFLCLVAFAQLTVVPLTLTEVRAYSRRSLDAVRAEIDLRRAGNNRVAARASILPQLAFNVSVSGLFAGPQRIFSTVPGRADNSFIQTAVDTPGFTRGSFALSLSLQQLIYDGGRWWNQIAQTGALEEAARGQLAEQRLASELEATRRFFNLYTAQVQLRAFEASLKRSREQVQRAKGLYDAGRAPKSAWLDARWNVGNERVAVLRQRQNIVRFQTELSSWLARPAEAIEAVVEEKTWDSTEVVPRFAVALASARKHRPLFHALAQRIRAFQLGWQVARADYWPRLTVSAGYARRSPTVDPFFTDLTKQNSVNAGLNLSWNLFSGLAHRANIKNARLELNRAEREKVQAFIELKAELKRVLALLKAELSVLKIVRHNLTLAKQQQQLEIERFEGGTATWLDARNAAIKLTEAHLSVLQAHSNVAIARAALRRVMGGLI